MARQQGYAVKITGFLPVDKADLKSQKAAIDALTKAADDDDASELLGLLEGVEIEHKLTSRLSDD